MKRRPDPAAESRTAPSPERTALSPERIVDVAVAIADREGIGAVSMRRVAREHDVTPMALYWHFADKDKLLDAMAEQVIADARFTDTSRAAWQTRYRRVLTTLVGLLRVHPWMGPLVIERLVPLPNFLQALEIMLECGRVAGLSPKVGAMVAEQAVQFTVVLAQYEPRPHTRAHQESPASKARALRELLDPDTLPNVRAAALVLTGAQDVDDYYRLGIDMILGGIRTTVESARPRATESRTAERRATKPRTAERTGNKGGRARPK